MRGSVLAASLLVLAATSCELPTIPVGPPLGLITFDGTWADGETRVAPSGQFYSGRFFDPELFASDTCQYFRTVGDDGSPLPSDRVGISPETQLPTSPYLGAGDRLIVNSSARIDSLPLRTQFGWPVGYFTVGDEELSFPAGDSVTVSFEGAAGGFPGAEIGIRLAEPFTVDTLPWVPGDDALDVTWDPAPYPGARMQVFLPFSSIRPPETASGANVILICSFPDAGAAQVPADLMEPWRAAWPDTRQFYARRVRYARIDLPRGAELHAISVLSMDP
jgi:hypothetical protein